MIYITEEDVIVLPITQTERKIAEKFAQEQSDPNKSQQIFLNTLAVLVVNDFLQMMGIETDLLRSDSWNGAVRSGANIADLWIPNLGQLECRPMLESETVCSIPMEVWSDRMGYVVVQICENYREGKLLGFVPEVAVCELPIRSIYPIDRLLEQLNPQPLTDSIIQLNHWFEQVFDLGWQGVETLLNPQQTELAVSFRSVERFNQNAVMIKRAKLINLGLHLGGVRVALVVELQRQINDEIGILLQVHPTGNEIYLPENLKLSVLDEADQGLIEAIARSTDNYIQLQFNGFPGESFKVRVGFEDVSLTETFVI